MRRCRSDVIIYHYTRADRVPAILATGSGLHASRKADWRRLSATPDEPHLAQGFLEPLPRWLRHSPYFGDLGWDLMRRHIGDVLLEIRLPATTSGLFVADYAHTLECKHVDLRGRPAMGLGYDCTSGHDSVRAGFNSYIPLSNYDGGHVAPTVELVRRGPGIIVPAHEIRIADVQPIAGVS